MPAQLHRSNRLLHRFRKLCLLHHLVAAQVDDLWHLFNEHRARLDTGSACSTRPQRFGRGSRHVTGDWHIKRQPLKLKDDIPRRKLLADGRRRAACSATTTLCAGIEIGEVFPRKISESIYAEPLSHIEIDRLERRTNWLE